MPSHILDSIKFKKIHSGKSCSRFTIMISKILLGFCLMNKTEIYWIIKVTNKDRLEFSQKRVLCWNSIQKGVSSHLLSRIFLKFLTTQKMKFSIKVFFSKCNQICRKLRIWSYLLKKSLIELFSFWAANCKSSWGE